MRTSRRLSIASAIYRFEYRPSKYQKILIEVLVLCAIITITQLQLLLWMKMAGYMLAMCYGWRVCKNSVHDRPCTVLIRLNTGEMQIDSVIVRRWQVAWQWPLVAVHYWLDDDHMRALIFWPDTLRPQQRRELRLAVKRCNTGRSRQLMAP